MRSSMLLVFLVCAFYMPVQIMTQNPFTTPFTQVYDAQRVIETLSTPSEQASTCLSPATFQSVNPLYVTGNTYTNNGACIQPYETLCRTPSGAVHCNTKEAACSNTARSNVLLYPGLASAGSGAVQQCVSQGVHVHDEVGSILPAQCLISAIVIIVTAIVVLVRTWSTTTWFVKLFFIWNMIVCIVLLPSYFYLNGLIGVLVSLFAVCMYSTHDGSAVSLGMSACIFTMMWFTFDSGLGYLIHTQHLTVSAAGDPINALYETVCNNYYRFSFQVPLELRSDNTNPASITNFACLRGWLSTELFFAVLLIVNLAVLAVAGIRSIVHTHDIVNESDPVAETVAAQAEQGV